MNDGHARPVGMRHEVPAVDLGERGGVLGADPFYEGEEAKFPEQIAKLRQVHRVYHHLAVIQPTSPPNDVQAKSQTIICQPDRKMVSVWLTLQPAALEPRAPLPDTPRRAASTGASASVPLCGAPSSQAPRPGGNARRQIPHPLRQRCEEK
jgi:hypothetical protein